ncbi:hypothetical protein ABW20_dc0100369 [Dactylellina cionopaga]|nr:hypothetical protein ABW20_dc0100369 [Dactylellina cionopaga]
MIYPMSEGIKKGDNYEYLVETLKVNASDLDLYLDESFRGDTEFKGKGPTESRLMIEERLFELGINIDEILKKKDKGKGANNKQGGSGGGGNDPRPPPDGSGGPSGSGAGFSGTQPSPQPLLPPPGGGNGNEGGGGSNQDGSTGNDGIYDSQTLNNQNQAHLAPRQSTPQTPALGFVAGLASGLSTPFSRFFRTNRQERDIEGHGAHSLLTPQGEAIPQVPNIEIPAQTSDELPSNVIDKAPSAVLNPTIDTVGRNHPLLVDLGAIKDKKVRERFLALQHASGGQMSDFGSNNVPPTPETISIGTTQQQDGKSTSSISPAPRGDRLKTATESPSTLPFEGVAYITSEEQSRLSEPLALFDDRDPFINDQRAAAQLGWNSGTEILPNDSPTMPRPVGEFVISSAPPEDEASAGKRQRIQSEGTMGLSSSAEQALSLGQPKAPSTPTTLTSFLPNMFGTQDYAYNHLPSTPIINTGFSNTMFGSNPVDSFSLMTPAASAHGGGFFDMNNNKISMHPQHKQTFDQRTNKSDSDENMPDAKSVKSESDKSMTDAPSNKSDSDKSMPDAISTKSDSDKSMPDAKPVKSESDEDMPDARSNKSNSSEEIPNAKSLMPKSLIPNSKPKPNIIEHNKEKVGNPEKRSEAKNTGTSSQELSLPHLTSVKEKAQKINLGSDLETKIGKSTRGFGVTTERLNLDVQIASDLERDAKSKSMSNKEPETMSESDMARRKVVEPRRTSLQLKDEIPDQTNTGPKSSLPLTALQNASRIDPTDSSSDPPTTHSNNRSSVAAIRDDSPSTAAKKKLLAKIETQLTTSVVENTFKDSRPPDIFVRREQGKTIFDRVDFDMRANPSRFSQAPILYMTNPELYLKGEIQTEWNIERSQGSESALGHSVIISKGRTPNISSTPTAPTISSNRKSSAPKNLPGFTTGNIQPGTPISPQLNGKTVEPLDKPLADKLNVAKATDKKKIVATQIPQNLPISTPVGPSEINPDTMDTSESSFSPQNLTQRPVANIPPLSTAPAIGTKSLTKPSSDTKSSQKSTPPAKIVPGEPKNMFSWGGPLKATPPIIPTKLANTNTTSPSPSGNLEKSPHTPVKPLASNQKLALGAESSRPISDSDLIPKNPSMRKNYFRTREHKEFAEKQNAKAQEEKKAEEARQRELERFARSPTAEFFANDLGHKDLLANFDNARANRSSPSAAFGQGARTFPIPPISPTVDTEASMTGTDGEIPLPRTPQRKTNDGLSTSHRERPRSENPRYLHPVMTTTFKRDNFKRDQPKPM